MPSVDPAAALAAGILFVTPNKRLARALRVRHDSAQVAAGAVAWPAARALPWSAWLIALWQDALAEGALTAPRALLAPGAAAFLWDRIVAASGNLLDARGAAVAAADAWTTFHAWREPHETFDAWRHAGISDDVALFAAWAAEFDRTLRTQERFDAAQLPEVLGEAAPRTTRWRGTQVVLAGFLEFSPQQRRLLGTLRAAGMGIVEMPLPIPTEAARSRAVCASAPDELRAAMAQARAWALELPALRIGVVFDDLRERRAEIRAAADDILCPEIAAQADPDRPRPYNLSLGERLVDVPLVSAAIALLAWPAAPLPVAEAAAVLRARHLPGGPEGWWRRAGLERRWRERGETEITYGAMLVVLPDVDVGLAERWRRAVPPGGGREWPAAWAEAWRTWLDAMGWPGDTPLGSAEWQARDAFWRALGDFAALGDLAGALPRGDAVAALRAALARTLFQPEDTGARIQILGTLEAAGLEFDRLWIAGLSATRWPGSAAPNNPLLPLAWQRERGVPRADARRTLQFAQAATAGFATAAPIVVASHASVEDDAPATVSELVADWQEAAPAARPTFAGQAAAMAAARPVLESRLDVTGPGLAPGGRAGGGVGVIEAQSECAFRAFARYRLRLREWPGEGVGLTSSERGSLLHRALAAVWGAIGDHARLCALDAAALHREVEAAVALAVAEVDAQRWRALPAPVAAAETERLGTLIGVWLDGFERPRPPFAVRDREMDAELALGDLAFRLRIDRVDQLADGGLAVIDYKSGRAPGATHWFHARPAGTQVGLYALALRAAQPEQPIRAVAYASLKAGEIGVTGLAADAEAWPAVPDVASRRTLPVATWPAVEAFWRSEYGALAHAFRAGAAAVEPRSGEVCNRCGMQALCRIRVRDDQDAEGGDEPDAG
jgi:probable DNA repair protein